MRSEGGKSPSLGEKIRESTETEIRNTDLRLSLLLTFREGTAHTSTHGTTPSQVIIQYYFHTPPELLDA